VSPYNVKYNSPGQSTREAAYDADVQFADELTDITASPGHAPASFMFSLDGATSFQHIEPVGGPYSTVQNNNFYTYQLVGQGHALRARISDIPLSDNNGMMQVTVVEAVSVVTPLLRQRQVAL
jgi:hypothetical protein